MTQLAVENELARRVAELGGRDLTEDDVHTFLLEAADLIGSAPTMLKGPGVVFRWEWDDGKRKIDIGVTRKLRGAGFYLTVKSFDAKVAERSEYLEYEQAAFEYPAPHWWWVVFADSPTQWFPGALVAKTWDQFDSSIGNILNHLPTDLALTPPAWRARIKTPYGSPGELACLFNMRDDVEWKGISFTASAEGIEIYSPGIKGPDLDLFVPRAILESGAINMTDVIAGFAGGTDLRGIEFFESSGFSFSPRSLRKGEWNADDFVDAEGEPLEDSARAGTTFTQLRAILEAGPKARKERPLRERTPFKLGLDFPTALDMVAQLTSGADPQAIFETYGARPGEVYGTPAFVADSWYARVKAKPNFRGMKQVEEQEVEISLSALPGDHDFPEPGELFRHAWLLSTEVAKRFGLAEVLHTTSDHDLSHLYKIGYWGVTVRTSLGELEINITKYDDAAVLAY